MYEVTLNTKSGPLGLGLASMPTGADRGAIVRRSARVDLRKSRAD